MTRTMRRLLAGLCALALLIGGEAIGQTNLTPPSFTSGRLPLNVVDNFGAACTGGDDTVALQAAAAASGAGTVGQISLPVGKTCNFSSPVQFANAAGPGFVCLTPGECVLNWTGSATANPILFASNSAPFGASEIVQVNGGTGYAAGNTVTLNDGCGTKAVVTIVTVSGGVPATYRITTMGSCAVKPAFNVTQFSTSGSGTGATFDMVYGSLGTQINYPTLDGVVLTSSTTMTENAFVRGVFTYAAKINNARLYGNSKVYQGFSFPRAFYTNIYDTRIEALLDQSILVSGTDATTNANVGTHLRNVVLAGCSTAVATKAIAKTKGCLRIGDYVGGIFVDDKMETYSHKGYAVYFAPTLAVASAGGMGKLANFNGLNIDFGVNYSGAIGGGNFQALELNGAASWMFGKNIDTLDFSSGTLTDIRINAQIYASQDDASNPAAINFNGAFLNLNGSEVGGYTTGTTGINLGTSASQVYLSSSTIQNSTVGIFGTTATGGIKTLAGVNFYNNTTDISGLTCNDFTISGGTNSAAAPLCGALTWTPTDASGAALTFTSVSANYSRSGNLVSAYGTLTYPATGSGNSAVIGGFPVAFPSAQYGRQCSLSFTSVATLARILPNASAATASLLSATGGAITNATMSGTTIYFFCTYPAS